MYALFTCSDVSIFSMSGNATKHAPVKTRRPRKNPLPCMNSELRGAIYRKHMLYAQYTKQRNAKNLDNNEIWLLN
jgi:hypothetical protein